MTNCTVENMVVQGEICMVAQPHDTQRWCHNALVFHRNRSYKHKLGFSEIRTVGDGVVQGRFPYRRAPGASGKRDIRADRVMNSDTMGVPTICTWPHQDAALAGGLFRNHSTISEPVAAQTASRCMTSPRASSRYLILYG